MYQWLMSYLVLVDIFDLHLLPRRVLTELSAVGNRHRIKTIGISGIFFKGASRMNRLVVVNRSLNTDLGLGMDEALNKPAL